MELDVPLLGNHASWVIEAEMSMNEPAKSYMVCKPSKGSKVYENVEKAGGYVQVY